MTNRYITGSMIVAICLLMTGCSDAYLSIEDTLGFKAYQNGTQAHTYLKISAYQWVDGQEGVQVGGPWIWDLPATEAGHTNWSNSSVSKRIPLDAMPEQDIAVRFKYHLWQNIHRGTQVTTTDLAQGWSQVVEPVSTPTSAYIADLSGDKVPDGINWWVQCHINPTRH
jgi:hypothetical protein